MTAEPSMSHNLSLMLSALFFLVWERYRDDSRLRIAALYGLIGGAMALVRQQDGLFLLLPYLAQIPTVWRGVRSGDLQPLLHTLRSGAVAALVALAVFSPQLAAWGVMYGNPSTIRTTRRASSLGCARGWAACCSRRGAGCSSGIPSFSWH